jgi:hypothetical protein
MFGEPGPMRSSLPFTIHHVDTEPTTATPTTVQKMGEEKMLPPLVGAASGALVGSGSSFTRMVR